MGWSYPAPLPPIGTLLAPAVENRTGAPAPLPSIGLLFGSGIEGDSLTAAAGSFAFADTATAALRYGHRLTTEVGEIAFTGIDADFTGSTISQAGEAAPLPSLSTLFGLGEGVKVLHAVVGTFATTGIAAALGRGHGLVAAAGSYTYGGAPSLSDFQSTENAANAFAFTGVEATLTRVSQGIIDATLGTFAFDGKSAALNYEQPGTARRMSPEPAFFSQVSGIDATLRRGTGGTNARVLAAETGAIDFDGQAAGMRGQFAHGPTWSSSSPADTIWTRVPRAGE